MNVRVEAVSIRPWMFFLGIATIVAAILFGQEMDQRAMDDYHGVASRQALLDSQIGMINAGLIPLTPENAPAVAPSERLY